MGSMPAEDTGSRAVPATRVACASVRLTPEAEAELLRRQCLKRKLVPEDIARAVLFFAADDSAACTAQSYVVDAGWT